MNKDMLFESFINSFFVLFHEYDESEDSKGRIDPYDDLKEEISFDKRFHDGCFFTSRDNSSSFYKQIQNLGEVYYQNCLTYDDKHVGAEDNYVYGKKKIIINQYVNNLIDIMKKYIGGVRKNTHICFIISFIFVLSIKTTANEDLVDMEFMFSFSEDRPNYGPMRKHDIFDAMRYIVENFDKKDNAFMKYIYSYLLKNFLKYEINTI